MRDEPYSPARLADLLQFVARNAAAQSGMVSVLPGDIAWRGPSADEVQLWYDDAGLAGYAWFEPPTGVELDLRHDLAWDGDVARAMLDRAEEWRRSLPEAYPWLVDLESMDAWAAALQDPRPPTPGDGRWLTVPAFERDPARVSALERRGYEPSRHYAPDYRFDLRGALPQPQLPAGMTVRHVTGADLAERVAVHRDAWVGSTWTLDRYRELRASPVYDPGLDLVVEAPDGSFAACCICWADEVSGIGSFEPVGTRPAWRGKGITRALIHEGFRLLEEQGMREARVETAGFNAPAQALYEGCGFRRTGTIRTYMQRLA